MSCISNPAKSPIQTLPGSLYESGSQPTPHGPSYTSTLPDHSRADIPVSYGLIHEVVGGSSSVHHFFPNHHVRPEETILHSRSAGHHHYRQWDSIHLGGIPGVQHEIQNSTCPFSALPPPHTYHDQWPSRAYAVHKEGLSMADSPGDLEFQTG